MALYRKQPQYFNPSSRGIPQTRDLSLLPFGGLEINDNPFLTKHGSAADMLNMVADDNYFLTLRPRLIDDPDYATAEEAFNAYVANGGQYYFLIDVIKLKDGYLFMLHDDGDGYALGVAFDNTFDELQFSSAMHSDLDHMSAFTFSKWKVIEEQQYYRIFINHTTITQLRLYKVGDVWRIEYADIYVPTYKAAITDLANLKDAPIYEDLNVWSPKYRLSFLYDEQSNLDLETAKRWSVADSGPVYKVTDLTGHTGRVILHYGKDGYFYYLAADYTTASAVGSGSWYNFTFYYHSFLTTTATTAFVIPVKGSALTGGENGISKTDLALLYSAEALDSNNKMQPPLIFDVASFTINRLVTNYPNVILYSYNVTGQAFTTKIMAELPADLPTPTYRIFYSNGVVAVLIRRPIMSDTTGVALVACFLSALTVVNLIGQTNDDDILASASIPSQHSTELLITNLFVTRDQIYILTNRRLDYLLNQTLGSGSSTILTPGILWDSSFNVTCLYYDVGSVIDEDSYTPLPLITISTNTTFATADNQLLLYNRLLGASASIGTATVYQIDLSVLTIQNTIDMSPLLMERPEIRLDVALITPWGDPVFLAAKTTATVDLVLIRVDVAQSKLQGLKYYYFPLATGSIDYTRAYQSGTVFDIMWATKLSRPAITTEPIWFEYLISNDSKNILKINTDVLADQANYISQFKPWGTVFGTALLSDCRIYYTNGYVFITGINNFNYLPLIHCQKAQQPIRFASSYLQSLGVVYERNNIEYVSFVENPFQEYIAHPMVPKFDSVEQRAIDYKPNAHLVTFAGVTIYLNDNGVYVLNFVSETPQDTERRATLISANVNSRLLKEDLDTCIMANYDPYVLFMFPKEDHTVVYALKLLSNSWFYWSFPFVVEEALDSNYHLTLVNGTRFVRLTEESEQITVPAIMRIYNGSVESYLDFGTEHIPWFWKSQLLALGSPTARKQILETLFTFTNPNAGVTINDQTFEVTQNKITTQEFGLRYYTYKDLVTEAPLVSYDKNLNIVNILRKRTYLNRFKFAQLLCYNIKDENTPTDRVRIADIRIFYKHLTGGK